MKDVHTEHCCIYHGCKYCDDDCTVMTKTAPQSYLCERCGDEGITSMEMLGRVIAGLEKRCPNCNHVLKEEGNQDEKTTGN